MTNTELHQLKETFLQEWPLSKIESMTLEEYTNLNKTSFCYWLEAKTEFLGSIWGGSAYKFGVYRRKDTSTDITVKNRVTDGEYAWFLKYGKTKEEAFQTVKSLLIKIINNAQNNTIENIDEIDLGNAYKWKIAFLYSDYKIVNIFKQKSLLEAAQSIGYKEKNHSYSVLNNYIIAQKDASEDYFDYTGKLWRSTTLNNSDDLLAQEGNESNFTSFLKKFKAEDVATYFNFLKEILNTFNLKQGDERLQFSYRNNGLFFTIGQRFCWYLNKYDKKGKFGVLSKDKLNETSSQFSGSKPFPWYSHFDEFIPSESDKKSILDGFSSQLEISKKSSYRKHNNTLFENAAFNHATSNSFQIKKNDNMPSPTFPLNQILYGPPGTGKTYNTVLESAKIVTCNETISYNEALKVFNENLGNQIEFITFHQNYSYEDFIQGIRPDTENGETLTFEKKDGVFKRIADKALKNLVASMNPESAKKEFDLVFHELIQPLNDGDVAEIEIKMKKSSFFITSVGEKSIEFRKSIGDSEHTLSINTLRKMYDRGVNDLVLGGLQQYYNPFLELLSEKGKSQVATVDRKNYVIIIDEINRANISRVFGELITLIEDDKRSNGKIPMRVTLPSGDTFIVPSNLHIIGTMNTADKSIALLDIALRRRFEFIAMYPDEAIVNDEFRDVFTAINKAILERKNHDFTIGHAYFMGEDCKLAKIINNKVIPLLMEYFMNDEKEVTAILQAAKITIGGWPIKMIV